MWVFRLAHIIVVMAALLASAVISAGTRAQSGDELDVLNRQVAQLLNTGKYTEALPLAQRTLALAYTRDLDGASGLVEARSRVKALK